MVSKSMGLRIPEEVFDLVQGFKKDGGLTSVNEALVDLIEKGLAEAGTSNTPRTQAKGAEANKWGRATARKLALLLDAKPVDDVSNEFTLEGQNISIRCAHIRTTSIGLTNNMRKRISYAIGAFEVTPNVFELFRVDMSVWKKHMHESKGTMKGVVTYLTRSKAKKFGEAIGELEIGV